ncbi:hypothetical protein [Limosilactobacillus oris]
MRPLFYDFAKDGQTWDISDEYMFGPDVLVSPILHAGQTKRDVYLPAVEDWIDVNTKQTYQGGQTVTVDCPIDTLPLFTRASHPLDSLLNFTVPAEKD